MTPQGRRDPETGVYKHYCVGRILSKTFIEDFYRRLLSKTYIEDFYQRLLSKTLRTQGSDTMTDTLIQTRLDRALKTARSRKQTNQVAFEAISHALLLSLVVTLLTPRQLKSREIWLE